MLLKGGKGEELMSIAGLDIGSGGCKCTIFNDNGNVSAYDFAEYKLIQGRYGYLELNPNSVWDAVQKVCLKAVSKHNGNKIKALCITSFGESAVLLDKRGKVLYNSMMYSDPRGEDQCQKIIKKLGKTQIMNRSGLSPHPMYSACKLMWLKDNEREIYDKIDTFLQYGDFILYKLSNEKFVDWSLASRSMLFNVINKNWDSFLLDGMGLDKKILPTTVKAGVPVATITKDAAELTGFPDGTILVLGGQDQVGAALGAGMLKKGQAVNGMGSVDCITPVFDKAIINDAMGDAGFACVPYVKENHYVTYAFNFSGGSLLRWYRDNFGLEDVEIAKQKGISAFSVMESKVPTDPTGMLVLPHWQGAATPYMDINSVGAIVGFNMNTDRYKVYRALMEGIAYEMKMNILSLNDAGVNIDRLTACGGGSRSQVWLQMRADIFNLPIDVLEVEEAGTLGATILAGIACGLFKSIEDGVARLVKIKKTYNPNQKNHEIYMDYFEKYQKMYKHIKQINIG